MLRYLFRACWLHDLPYRTHYGLGKFSFGAMIESDGKVRHLYRLIC